MARPAPRPQPPHHDFGAARTARRFAQWTFEARAPLLIVEYRKTSGRSRRAADDVHNDVHAAEMLADGISDGGAVVIDGGKMQSGGGGASTQSMLDWTDEQWEAIRPKKK